MGRKRPGGPEGGAWHILGAREGSKCKQRAWRRRMSTKLARRGKQGSSLGFPEGRAKQQVPRCSDPQPPDPHQTPPTLPRHCPALARCLPPCP